MRLDTNKNNCLKIATDETLRVEDGGLTKYLNSQEKLKLLYLKYINGKKDFYKYTSKYNTYVSV